MSNYDDRNKLLKLLERMTQLHHQEQKQERLQRAAWAWAQHQQWLLLQQPQYHLHYPPPSHQLPYVNQPKSVPTMGPGPPSFLEFDNSFLTPWQWQGRGDDHDSASAGSYVYDLETGVPRMQLQPGSFFKFEPLDLIEQIRAQRSTESFKDKQEDKEDEDNVKRDAVQDPEGMKITTAKDQFGQVKNAAGQGKGKEKIRDGAKRKSVDKEGNNNLEEEEKDEDEIVYVASTSDNVDSQAMKYMYQADRQRYKKTFSRKPGKS